MANDKFYDGIYACLISLLLAKPRGFLNQNTHLRVHANLFTFLYRAFSVKCIYCVCVYNDILDMVKFVMRTLVSRDCLPFCKCIYKTSCVP